MKWYPKQGGKKGSKGRKKAAVKSTKAVSSNETGEKKKMG